MDQGTYIYNILTISSTDAVQTEYKDDLRWMFVMMNIECTPLLCIPPGVLYTSMEKLILAFDDETWYGICVTFIISCIAVTIFNQFPKSFKELAYGRTGGTSAFNTFQTFFGISQAEVPKGNFARFVMTSFVFWCLVIRTAYQGKLFGYTTTAVRKPELKTLEELKNQNFTLFFSNFSIPYPMLEYTKKVIDMPSKTVSLSEYTNIYIENLTDPSFTGTVLTCDIEHKMHVFLKQMPMPRKFISTPFSKSHYGIGFKYANLWAERFNEVVEGLVTGGIMNYFLEGMTKSKWNLMEINENPEKVVLNMSHLGFGFQICFLSLYVSLIVLILEIIVNWIASFMTEIEDDDQTESIIDKALMDAFETSVLIIEKSNLKPSEFEERIDSVDTIESEIEAELSEPIDNLFGEEIKCISENIDVVSID